MSKFKVGDRVVEDKYVGGADLVEHWNEYWKSAGPFEGAFYVTGLLHSGDEVSYSNKPGGNGPICPARYLKLAPRFAVGDKVRAVRDSIGGGYTKGKTYVVKTCRDNHITTEFDDSGSRTNGWGADNFEPAYTSCAAAEVDNLAAEYGAPDSGMSLGDILAAALRKPTALTIEAGKYYKTRDGRKVGPMEANIGGFKWSNHGEVRWVDAEGRHRFGLRGCDLIAEWTDEPASANFKIGDRVRIARSDKDFKQKYIGNEFIIQKGEYASDGESAWTGAPGSSPYIWRSSELELLTAPTTIADIVAKHSQTGTAIVCLLENGTPKPSTVPFVHNNSTAAETEATRLANIHKGKEFGVYTLGTVAKVERTYDHEWQRLAAGGSKIPAIKAYRDAGGKRETFVSSEFGYRAGYENRFVIGLKEAKDAVEYWLATAA